MLDTREDLLSLLLQGTAEELDIPPAIEEELVAEYGFLGHYLANYGRSRNGADWTIYVQGSFMLGTVVRSLYLDDGYDIDAVCRIDLAKTGITQVELKSLVADAIAEYVAIRKLEKSVQYKEGRRCCTLIYPGYHFDTLPAIPDPDAKGTAILLTDTELRAWQHSDPLAYARWFRKQMEMQFKELRSKMAAKRGCSVEEVPEWQVKTVLQRVVQVLKIHRDMHYMDMRELRPPSILLTTLAAKSYTGQGHLFTATAEIAKTMTDHFEHRADGLWLPNPVCEEENFADRLRTRANRN